MGSEVIELDVNGTKVPLVFESDNRLPIVSMQIVFQNGGSISNTKLAGLARAVSKMYGEGTATLGSKAFAQKLDAKAIHISASTGGETFVFELSCLKEHMQEGVQALASLIKDPNLSEDALSQVKTVTLGEIQRKSTDFDYIAGKTLKELMFKNTVLALPTIGTQESITKLTLADINNFIEEHIVSSRAIVVMGGDLSQEEATLSVQTILASVKVGKMSELPYFNVNKKVQEEIVRKKTEQAYVYFGSPFNMKTGDAEYYKSRVAIFILGSSGFGSRLMEEIRVKKGLAYSAYGRVTVNQTSSYFSGYLQTKLESQNEAQKSVNEVIHTFVDKGVTQEELDQAKRFLLGSEPLRVETLSQRLGRTFMDYYKGAPLNNSQLELDKIETLDLKDLNAFIKKHKEILDLTYAIVTQ
ncbi:insulinase family protein [Sulfurimonas sp. MAG313]|nr:insulinase family protein [Sulfurimonas sp. MAG313]